MTRTEIINHLIRKVKGTSYLEIGVREPQGNYNHILCENKIAVDPVPLGEGILPLTSDEFFKQNLITYDVIFIDGLHEEEQVMKDIVNSLKVLNEGGYIICHDMSPTTELMQRVPIETNEAWTGDCWKAWVKLRSSRKDLSMFVVDTDFGVGIIKKGKQKCLSLGDLTLNYNNLEANRTEWLNLISIQEFYELSNSN
jgi:hypothetical protein